jgi:hypothetical protein
MNEETKLLKKVEEIVGVSHAMVVLENNNGHLRQLSAEGPPLFRALLASPRE